MIEHWRIVTGYFDDAHTAFESWCDGDLRSPLRIPSDYDKCIVLLCTPGIWRFIFAIGILENQDFWLIINLKNVVPLVGRNYLPDRMILGPDLDKLKRRVLIHNPGVGCLLERIPSIDLPQNHGGVRQ